MDYRNILIAANDSNMMEKKYPRLLIQNDSYANLIVDISNISIYTYSNRDNLGGHV